MEFTYLRSPHEEALEALFGELAATKTPSIETIPCIVIGFVNRSGSNYLAELLKSTGHFAGLSECLNAPTVSYLAPRYEVNTLPDYLLRHRMEDTKLSNQLWGFKAAWHQLTMLLGANIFGKFLSPTFINVRRRDVAAQAVSYFIAERTSQWTSNEEQVIARNKVAYDGDAILAHYYHIVDSYSKLEQVTFLSGYPTHHVIYEDLLDCPNSTIAKLTGAISGRELIPAPHSVGISVQRDGLDCEFKSRFLSDLASLKWRGQ
jgi:trehalose 2-sulfotransferase